MKSFQTEANKSLLPSRTSDCTRALRTRRGTQPSLHRYSEAIRRCFGQGSPCRTMWMSKGDETQGKPSNNSTALWQIGNPEESECTMALLFRKISILQHVDPGLHYLLHWSHTASADRLYSTCCKDLDKDSSATAGVALMVEACRNEVAGSATGFNRFYRMMHTIVGSTQAHIKSCHLLGKSFCTKTK